MPASRIRLGVRETPWPTQEGGLPMADEKTAGDEETLLARVAHAHVDAFEVLYDRYSRSIYSLAWTMLRDPQAAQDVTQEVFLAIWRGAHTFDRRSGSPRSWLLSLAHHKSVDAVRRLRTRAVTLLDDPPVDDVDVVSEALHRVDVASVREALAGLSHDQCEAIVLAYYGGYTQREIAARLGIPLGTVKTRIRDALIRLRTLLGSLMGEQAR